MSSYTIESPLASGGLYWAALNHRPLNPYAPLPDRWESLFKSKTIFWEFSLWAMSFSRKGVRQAGQAFRILRGGGGGGQGKMTPLMFQVVRGKKKKKKKKGARIKKKKKKILKSEFIQSALGNENISKKQIKKK